MNTLSATALLLLTCALYCPSPNVRGRLQQSKRRHPGSSTLLVSAVCVGTLAFYFLGQLSTALAAILISSCVVWTINNLLQARRRKRGQEAVAAFLGMVTADLRSGSTLPSALARGVQSLPANSPPEFNAVLHSAAVLAHNGASPHTVLRQSGHLELVRLGHLIELANTHGIALATLLEQAQSRIDAQRRHAQATAASLQGPQATAIVLAFLPLAGIAMGATMGANSLGFLLGGGIGGILLVVGTFLLCGGFVWSRLIIEKASPC